MAQFKQYTMADVNRMTAKDLRKLYTKYRHYANERLDKLSEFKERGYKIAEKEFGSGYKMNKKELVDKMVDVSRFMVNPLSQAEKLKEYEARQIEKLQRHGVEVDENSFPDFYKFMEQYRQEHIDELFDSDQVAEVFNTMKKWKVTPADIALHKDEFKKRNLSIRQAIVLTARRKSQPAPSQSWRRKMGIR